MRSVLPMAEYQNSIEIPNDKNYMSYNSSNILNNRTTKVVNLQFPFDIYKVSNYDIFRVSSDRKYIIQNLS